VHREDRFLISRKPYAVDLDSLTIAHTYERWDGNLVYRAHVSAVWYRRRKGLTYACIGTLWDHQDAEPTDAHTFLSAHDDGRYGGACEGRWDGTRYWGAQEPDVMAAHMEILRPMLDSYPVIPTGFDGWWTFQPPRT
jgi:hypothetical protein